MGAAQTKPGEGALSLPAGLTLRRSGRGGALGEHDVSDEELARMKGACVGGRLAVTPERLALDYGEQEAAEMLAGFRERGAGALLGVLAWPGIGTRWRSFLAWLDERRDVADAAAAGVDAAFDGFARFLGRVVSYRALALDAAGLARIEREDEIFPSGRLRVGREALDGIVEEHGVRKIVVARLFISHLKRLIGHDPSISLHDDWQTTTAIAAGYASAAKRVHLFELSVPVVESLGWTLLEVARRSGDILGPEYADHERWFCFPTPAAGAPGVWFDATLQRTERYGLGSIPFLARRLCRLVVLEDMEQIRAAVAPFVAAQAADRAANPE